MSTVNDNIYWGLNGTILHLSSSPTAYAVNLFDNSSDIEAIRVNRMPYYDDYRVLITQVVFDNIVTPSNTALWFNGLENLKTIKNLNFLDTSNITSMNGMFRQCKNLQELDLSTFNTSNVTNMKSMFYMNQLLTTIYVSDLWDINKVTESSYMFFNCNSLVGGNGTTFSSDNNNDVTYAVIDKIGQTGYLTYKGSNTSQLDGEFNGEKIITIYFNGEQVTSLYFNDEKIY